MIIQAKNAGVLVNVQVDDEDALLIGNRKLSIGSHGYAQIWDGGKLHLLHRWILGLEKGDGMIGDHINHDVWDNRRANLRAVTPSESNENRHVKPAHKYIGVYPIRSGRWQARVKRGGKLWTIGTYDTPEQARDARNCY